MSIYVRNNTSSVITRGQAVYSDGTAGGLPRVALAKANAASTLPCIGVALEHIDPSQDGRIGTNETVVGMDTSGFALGDLLYVSAATAGALTATVPASPNIVQRVGRVTAVSARDGRVALQVEPANFAQDGTYEVSGTTPEFRSTETGQVDPLGRFRWRGESGNYTLYRAKTAAWATQAQVLGYNLSNKYVGIFGDTDNTWYARIDGGVAGDGGSIFVGGSASGAALGFDLRTGNNSGSMITRMSISAAAVTPDIDLANCRLDANGVNIAGVVTVIGENSAAMTFQGNRALTDATEYGILFQLLNAATDTRTTIFNMNPNGANPQIGFFNVTPVARPSAYTQTYATADKTHATPTVGADIGAFTDPPTAAEMATLRTFVNALKADHADLAQLANAIIDDGQALGLLS